MAALTRRRRGYSVKAREGAGKALRRVVAVLERRVDNAAAREKKAPVRRATAAAYGYNRQSCTRTECRTRAENESLTTARVARPPRSRSRRSCSPPRSRRHAESLLSSPCSPSLCEPIVSQRKRDFLTRRAVRCHAALYPLCAAAATPFGGRRHIISPDG